MRLFGRDDQPDVDGRPGRRHRPRDRRRGRGGREHPSPARARRGADAIEKATARAGGAGGGLDPHDGRGVRAAGRCCRAWSASSSAPCRITLSVAVLDVAGAGADASIPLLAHWAIDGQRRAAPRTTSTRARRPRTARRLLEAAVLALAAPCRLVGVRRAGPVALLSTRCVGSGFLPDMDEGGFVIDYLTPAGHGARGDRPRMMREGREDPGGDAGGGVVLPPHRRRAGDVRDPDEQGRRPGAAQAARPAQARRPTRSSRRCATRCTTRCPASRSSSSSSCRTCSGTSRAQPTPIEVKIFGDDAERARRARRGGPADGREGPRRRGRRRRRGRQPGGRRGRSTRWPRRALGPDRRAGRRQQLQRALAGRGRRRSCACSIARIPVRVRYPDAVRLRPRDAGRRRRCAAPTASWRRSPASPTPASSDGRADHAAREPAPDGAGHRAPRRARPRQRGGRDPGDPRRR